MENQDTVQFPFMIQALVSKVNTILNRGWAIGFLLILIFILVGELTVIFNDYVFHRLSINRTIFILVLWILPFAASFLASYYS